MVAGIHAWRIDSTHDSRNLDNHRRGSGHDGPHPESLRLLKTDLTARMDHDKKDLEERVARIEAGQGDLRERMALLQGLLQGLREAITRGRAA